MRTDAGSYGAACQLQLPRGRTAAELLKVLLKAARVYHRGWLRRSREMEEMTRGCLRAVARQMARDAKPAPAEGSGPRT